MSSPKFTLRLNGLEMADFTVRLTLSRDTYNAAKRAARRQHEGVRDWLRHAAESGIFADIAADEQDTERESEAQP